MASKHMYWEKWLQCCISLVVPSWRMEKWLQCCISLVVSVAARVEGDAYTQYKAMIVATGLQLLLLMFELLACDKLGSNPHKMLWVLVCIPLFCVSVASIGLCVWALKHGRTFEVSTQPLCVVKSNNMRSCN